MSSVVHSFRTFIAIEVPRDIRRHIIQHIERLRRELPDLRASWSREDNLHLTLKFLGNVAVEDIPKLSHAVEAAAQNVAPFEINVSGCGTFPARGRPSVLWIGTEAAGLTELHFAMEEECAIVGFAHEQRAFHPHLTIARLRSSQNARRLADLHRGVGFQAESFRVSNVVVFRSELLREGSKHNVISRHELEGVLKDR